MIEVSDEDEAKDQDEELDNNSTQDAGHYYKQEKNFFQPTDKLFLWRGFNSGIHSIFCYLCKSNKSPCTVNQIDINR